MRREKLGISTSNDSWILISLKVYISQHYSPDNELDLSTMLPDNTYLQLFTVTSKRNDACLKKTNALLVNNIAKYLPNLVMHLNWKRMHTISVSLSWHWVALCISSRPEMRNVWFQINSRCPKPLLPGHPDYLDRTVRKLIQNED